MRPVGLQPLHCLAQQVAAQTTVERFYLQPGFSANADPPLAVIDTDIQLVLLFSHFLPG
ncbi:hypothetical protein D3C80_2049840 [compost metagenome]